MHGEYVWVEFEYSFNDLNMAKKKFFVVYLFKLMEC